MIAAMGQFKYVAMSANTTPPAHFCKPERQSRQRQHCKNKSNDNLLITNIIKYNCEYRTFGSCT